MKKMLMGVLALSISTHSFANLTNYDEPNTAKLVNAMKERSFHIVQLGDSHTAGDSMTDALRGELQAVYGNGGMGWSMPMYFSGQRLAEFGYDNQGWTPISSRRTYDEDYTLGGLLAKPNGVGSRLTIKSKKARSEQTIIVSIKQGVYDDAFLVTDAHGEQFSIEAPKKNGLWQTATFKAALPFSITAQGLVKESYIGGWWAFNPARTGAVVSALGINGAQLAHWSRWNTPAWQNELQTVSPNLIVLAYGTNEAYGDVNPDTVRQTLQNQIGRIRSAVPDAAIMIVSSPEALKSTSGSCGVRPTYLTQIQQVQQEVAMSERTLFWDWQQAMGGSCSMTSWIRHGKASKDGVHFTHSGYTELGKKMANDLMALADDDRAIGSVSQVPSAYQ